MLIRMLKRGDPEELTRAIASVVASEGEGLFCFLCGRRITGAAARISVQGGHEHGFSNPAGFAFRIGCFSQAPGCAAEGTPTAEHTWFAGCRWRYALCAGCRVHLGWEYSSMGGDGFFGLILDRLVAWEARTAPPGLN
jgi:hypothetical protein